MMDLSPRGSLPGYPNETGDDFIDSYQLRTLFSDPFVEHQRRFSDISRGIRNQIEIKQWRRVRELGRGGFGTVYLEVERGGEVRAVKEIPKYTNRTRTMDHLREILAMAHFSVEDTFFIGFQGWFQNPHFIFIAMEYAPHGDLEECVKESLPEQEAQTIASQLIEALTIMHRKHFSHRDLKPSNVFVVSKSPTWWVKLGDFGVSKRVRGDSTSMHTSIETDYSAPEILGFIGDGSEESSKYTNAVDMWSLGCLLHWILTQRLPLSKWELMPYCLGRSSFPNQHLTERGVSQLGIDFIQKLIAPQPEDRINAFVALRHGWPREFSDAGGAPTQQPWFGTTNHTSAAAQVDFNTESRANHFSSVLPALARGPKSPQMVPINGSHSKTINPDAQDILAFEVDEDKTKRKHFVGREFDERHAAGNFNTILGGREEPKMEATSEAQLLPTFDGPSQKTDRAGFLKAEPVPVQSFQPDNNLHIKVDQDAISAKTLAHIQEKLPRQSRHLEQMMQHSYSGQGQPPQQSQPLSRTPSQMLVTDRPNSSLSQPQTPSLVSASGQPPSSRQSSSPAPKPSFRLPPKKNAAIAVKNPQGDVVNFSKPAPSSAHANPSPGKAATPPAATPAGQSGSTPDPSHSRTDSVSTKTNEEKKREMQEAVAKKLAEEAKARQDKEDAEKDALASQEKEAADAQEAAAKEAEAKATAAKEAEVKAAQEISRRLKAAVDRTKKLNDLVRFSKTFQLKTPVPPDLVAIIAKTSTKEEASNDPFARPPLFSSHQARLENTKVMNARPVVTLPEARPPNNPVMTYAAVAAGRAQNGSTVTNGAGPAGSEEARKSVLTATQPGSGAPDSSQILSRKQKRKKVPKKGTESSQATT